MGHGASVVKKGLAAEGEPQRTLNCVYLKQDRGPSSFEVYP